MKIINFLNDRVFGALLPFLLIGAGIYFCIRLRFFHFLHPIRSARMMLKKDETQTGEGPVRALLLALAGTLGVGNITGVALAISVGGAGAVFWMWVSAAAAMIIRYAEIVLALDSRKYEDGEFHGAAMYYIESGVGGSAGKIFALIFGVLCLLCSFFIGGIIQSSVISESFHEIFSISKTASGIFVGALAFFVIIGGAKKISAITMSLVPFMTVLYVLISIVAILSSFGGMGEVLKSIFSQAFRFEGAGAGIFGFFASDAVRSGVSRGLISNEAGCGTAPMAHSTSGVSEPSRQGLLGIFEVFIDTVVLCSLTAFVILLNCDSIPTSDSDGMMTVISAFSAVFGRWAGVIISVCIFFFAFATIICWAYYGQSCVRYFSKKHTRLYTILFCASLIGGAVLAPSFIWGATDVIIGAMTVINICALMTKADRVVALSAKSGLIKTKIKARGCVKRDAHPQSTNALSYR